MIQSNREIVETLLKELKNRKDIILSRLKIHNLNANAEDYINDVIYAVVNNEKLSKCNMQSVIQCALQAAKYSLPLGGNIASLVPNGDKARFEIGYEGYPVLIARIISIKYKVFDVLYEGDILQATTEEGFENCKLKYRASFSIKRSGKKDKIIGAFALISLADDNSFFLQLTAEEIKKFKPKYDTNFWKDWDAKMHAKAVLKELGRKVYRMYNGTSTEENCIEAIGEDENIDITNNVVDEITPLEIPVSVEEINFEDKEEEIINESDYNE